jgi:hypothetical protein
MVRMTGPKNPKSPKGQQPIGGKRRGWQEGRPRLYTPDQTQRYQSQWTRYKKASELAIAGPDFVQTLNGVTLSGGNQYKYLYYSEGAPLGFWTVTRSTDGGGQPGDGDDQNQNAPWLPDDPDRRYRVFYIQYQPLPAPQPTYEEDGIPGLPYAPAVPCNPFTQLRFGAEVPIAPGFENMPPIQYGQFFGYTSFLSQEANGVFWELNGWSGVYAVTAYMSFGGGAPSFYSFIHLSRRVAKEDSIFPLPRVRLGFDPSTPYITYRFGKVADERDQACFPDYQPPGGGGGTPGGGNGGNDDEWECDCPDYSKQIEADNRSRFPSRQAPREWQQSEAGATGDCKHIMATKLYLGLPVPVPNDPPVQSGQ